MLEAQETKTQAPRSQEGKLEDRGALDPDPEDNVGERKREDEGKWPCQHHHTVKAPTDDAMWRL